MRLKIPWLCLSGSFAKCTEGRGISWDHPGVVAGDMGGHVLREVLASAQKNLTDFPVLRHLAMREDPQRAGFGLTTSVLEYSIGLLALILLCSLLVCLPGRFQPLTCRNWCEAASSALSSSSEIRITVARTPAELQVCRAASADAVVSV